MYKAALTFPELEKCGTFLENYLINFKLFRYLFKPLNLLKVVTK